MNFPRFYQPVLLQENTRLVLDERVMHYLLHVRRASKGDRIILFNGQGGQFLAEITEISKRTLAVAVLEHVKREVESPLKLTLAQGIAKGEKMDFIVQKAVELGVSFIQPLVTARSTVHLTGEREEKRLRHWQAIAISACEQSGRNHVPEVLAPLPFSKWLEKAQANWRFILTPHHSSTKVSPIESYASISLLIGPEGGFDQQEIATALENGFLPLNLGPRILRTETATLAALVFLQSHYGDMA